MLNKILHYELMMILEIKSRALKISENVFILYRFTVFNKDISDTFPKLC